MKTYFLSYGDENFSVSKKRILKEANESQMFNYCDVYGPEDLSPEFVQKTSPHIQQKRGGGYWLWKPFLIKKTFDRMQENDICVYADAGCHVNIHGVNRMKEYYQMITDSDTGTLSFDLYNPSTNSGLIEESWTTEKLFEYFNIKQTDIFYRKSNQIMATILFFRKCKKTCGLVEHYYNIAENSPELFTDTYNDYKQTIVFKDHRHDQSVLSILRKMYGSVVIPDETYSDRDWKPFKHIPILSTRIKG